MTDSTDALPEHEEYERRFLVDDLAILDRASSRHVIHQAYLWAEAGWAARVRITRPDGEGETPKAVLTLKGPRVYGHRYEFETEMPLDPAEEVVALAQNVVLKTRYSVFSENDLWDIDVFQGKNEGLVIAEYEASKNAVARVKKPWWAGEEITDRPEYNNEAIAFGGAQ